MFFFELLLHYWFRHVNFYSPSKLKSSWNWFKKCVPLISTEIHLTKSEPRLIWRRYSYIWAAEICCSRVWINKCVAPKLEKCQNTVWFKNVENNFLKIINIKIDDMTRRNLKLQTLNPAKVRLKQGHLYKTGHLEKYCKSFLSFYP